MTGRGIGRVVVVTGASSGIGRAAARMFAARGDRVVLAARREDRLEALSDELKADGHEALSVPIDLARVNEAAGLVERTIDAFGRLDVLVNNAGYGAQMHFTEAPIDDVSQMMAVNALSPMALARAAVPHMRAQGSGSIVNVASVGGVVGHPLVVAYCASKHALVGFSKGLRLELAGTGIRVVCLCPAATRTEFFEVARRDIPFESYIERLAAPSEVVARAIVKATTSRRAIVFPTWGAYFLYWLDRWIPWLSDALQVRYRNNVLRLAQDADTSNA